MRVTRTGHLNIEKKKMFFAYFGLGMVKTLKSSRPIGKGSQIIVS